MIRVVGDTGNSVKDDRGLTRALLCGLLRDFHSSLPWRGLDVTQVMKSVITAAVAQRDRLSLFPKCHTHTNSSGKSLFEYTPILTKLILNNFPQKKSKTQFQLKIYFLAYIVFVATDEPGDVGVCYFSDSPE